MGEEVSLLSIIMPARDEPYLQRTIDGIFASAAGDVEVIVVLDGYWPDPPIEANPRLTLVHFSEPQGMRSSINAAARLANGKYLMKCDAHCLFAEGFDVALSEVCEPDWTLVPQRYKLNVEDWTRGKEVCSFEYIDIPSFKGRKWPEYAERIGDEPLVDLMTFQGSCWFMHRERFWDLGGLDDVNYGMMGREAQEISLKTWLSGGRQLLARNTWYAHWSKPNSHYPGRSEAKKKSIAYAQDLWLSDGWPLQTMKRMELFAQFAPLPG